jgi:hypothetical protein
MWKEAAVAYFGSPSSAKESHEEFSQDSRLCAKI